MKGAPWGQSAILPAKELLACTVAHMTVLMQQWLLICLQGLKVQHPRLSCHVQDSDERAVAYIAGKAPSRWGSFGADSPVTAPVMVVCPQVLLPNASSAQIERNTEIRRAHPLYADVSLRLLTEIMNSRLFTTVSFM